VTGMSAAFCRLKIGSRIVLHKKRPLNKLLNKRSRIAAQENNIANP
jgi:hypothetical protein